MTFNRSSGTLAATMYWARGFRAELVCAFAIVSTLACSTERHEPVDDPVPNVPLEHQRTISRSALQWRWPFTVGTGTLACDSGAVLFRSNGTTHALNDAARARRFEAPDAIRAPESSGPPRNPLGRITQDTRMNIFAQSSRCSGSDGGQPGSTASCRARILAAYSLSESELKQIEAEGEERYWKPLNPPFKSLDPVVEMGSKLCR